MIAWRSEFFLPRHRRMITTGATFLLQTVVRLDSVYPGMRGDIMKQGTKRLLKILSASLALLLLLAAPAGAALAATADTKAPNAPRLAVSSVGQTTLKLHWSPSADNVGVTSYAVYQNYAYLTICKTSYTTIGNLKPGTSYTFYVAAQDAAGNLSKKSNIITVKTAPASAGTAAAPAAAAKPAATAKPAAAPTAPSSGQAKSSPGKIVAGYYASWAAYSGYTPNDIPAANLTHVLYAFANISSTYRIMLGDSQVDPDNLAELKAMKKRNSKLKTLISVGGWTWADKFSDMAATATRRDGFADSVVQFLRKYGLDGVDLDWEYPVSGGLKTNSARAADKTNFTLLLKTLRGKLDAAGRADGKRYLLTIAGGAGKDYVGNVQLSTIAKYLDFAVVMTYDMHGPQDRYTDHNAPLYPAASSPQNNWSADQAVKAWTGAGFPKGKLVMGVPFYGHRYSNVKGGGTGIHKTYSGYKTVSYDQVVSQYLSTGKYTRYYGAAGRTPWIFNGSTFITYEDARSLKEKMAYITKNGLAGCGIWELSENVDGTLLKTVRANLK